MANSVFGDWFFALPFQQQRVLVLALRGPDGVRKHHPMKEIQRMYRGTVLKAARYGRFLDLAESADTFMAMDHFSDPHLWKSAVKAYFNHIDELPHHFHMRLMHGAEIIGYKHPDIFVAGRWQSFYYDCCEDAHVPPETHEQMDERLSDWGREFWVDEE